MDDTINDEGVSCIASGLRSNKWLKQLKLCNCTDTLAVNAVRNEGASNLGTALKTNNELTTLHLSKFESEPIGSKAMSRRGVYRLLKKMGRNNSVTHLRLNKEKDFHTQHISNEVIENAFKKLVGANCTLAFLDISTCRHKN